MAAEPGTDRSGIDGPTADGAGPPPEAHEFQIRPTRSAFPVLWDCLLPATAFLCYLPYATDLIAKLYLAFFGTFAVVPIVVAMFTRKGRRVRVDETGITVGRRRVLWEEVRDIRKWVLPITPITLVLKGRWRTMQLAACPEVLGGVLPAVLRIRPDLKVSKRVLRAMEFPEGTPRLRRWQTAGLLVMAMFLAFFPLMARQADALWALGALLALALCPFVSMLTPASTDDAKLALGTMFASLIVFFSFKIHLLCDVPTFVLDAVVATGAAMAFAAAVVHGFRWRLDFGRKAAIVACVLAVAAGF